MYIQDPTLASAFCEAEKEYTEQVENEILARYKELQECGFSENEALERTKGAEGERYKRFLKILYGIINADTEKKTAEPTAQITEKERFLMLMKETSCKRNTKNM